MSNTKTVSFSGLDGAGKSTQINEIKRRFEEKGLKVKVKQHFESVIGEKCKDIIKTTSDPYIRALAFALDEYSQKGEEDTNYDLILCDRNFYCAIAYSGAQGLSEGWLRVLYKFAYKYDLCIYLDITENTSYLRKGLDEISPKFNNTQLSHTRNIYLDLVERGEMLKINAEQEIDKITHEIEILIEEMLNECK